LDTESTELSTERTEKCRKNVPKGTLTPRGMRYAAG